MLTDRPRAAAVGLTLVLLLTAAAPAIAAEATARDVRGWLADLSHRLPARREVAHRKLIGLSRHGLDLLHDGIKDHAQELAAEQDLLHDVVVQAFLATEPYTFDPAAGFMGVQFDEDQEDDSPYDGVEIRHMMAGLCASQYLEEGDVVYDIRVGQDVWKLHTSYDMMGAVKRLVAGQEITVTVLRRGRLLSIDMRLGGAPPNIRETALQFQAERQTEAEAYWDDHFAVLFNPPPPPAPAPSTPLPARASAADR